MQHTTLAVDHAKTVFQVAVSHRPGQVDETHRLSRARFVAFFAPNFLHHCRMVSYDTMMPRSARRSLTSRKLKRCFRHQVLLRRDRHVHDGCSGRPVRVSERQYVA